MACIGGLFLQLGYLAWRILGGIDSAAVALSVVGLLMVGYYLADLISGVVHWMGDTIGAENTPILGPAFIKPFRLHHSDPKDITRHDFVETNGNNCIVSVMVMAHVVWLMPAEAEWLYYYGTVMFSAALWIFGTNQFHKWSHADRVPSAVGWLQRRGLILGVGHHETHHTPPYDTYYCITHGQLNPLLARIGFFRFLERTVALIRPSALHLDERKKFAARTSS